MSYEEQIFEFLRRAQEAEAHAVAAADPFVRAEWARIAMSYRDLVETVRNTAVMAELSEQP
jgi:hypothetical protein